MLTGHAIVNRNTQFASRKMAAAVLAISCSGSMSPGVFAQEMETVESRLEEVIVTAQKREQGLQDVPISITVIGSERLNDIGAVNYEQLSGSVPGLQIAKSVQETSIYLRGVGSGVNKAFEQSVAQFVDGMFVGRSYQYQSPLLDLERVEVLRGPQGVLFGKNTIGGVINVVSASPDLGAGIEGSLMVEYVPTWNSQHYEGAVNLPVSDSFGLRLAGILAKADGWTENEFLGTDDVESDNHALRATALWLPTDALEVNLKFSTADTERSGQASGLSAFELVAPPSVLLANGFAAGVAAFGIVSAAFPGITDAAGKDFTVFHDGTSLFNENGAEISSDSVILNVSYDWGEYSLKSTTSYSQYDVKEGVDADFTPLRFISVSGDQDFSQFSQEFTLYSPTGGKFEWIGGVYFDDQDFSFKNDTLLDGTLGQSALLTQILGRPSLFGPISQVASTTFFDQQSTNWSVFAQGTFHLSDTLSVTGGVRYSEDKKDVLARQVYSSNITGGLGSEFATTNPGVAGVFSNVLGRSAYDFPKQSRSENHLIPAIKVEWHVLDSTQIYFSYAQGYKAGGFDGSENADQEDSSTPGPAFQYDSEEAATFEVGAKFDFPEQSLRGSLAVYTTDYQDLQVSAFDGTGFVVSNAAAATINGVEVEFQWSPFDDFLIGGAAAYLNFEYDEYSAGCTIGQDLANRMANPGTACKQDLAGREGAYTPEYTGSLYVTYEYPVTDSMNMVFGTDVNYVDEYFSASDLEPNNLSPATTKIDLRVGLADIDGQWEVTLFGRNITDEATLSFGADVPLIPGSHFTYYGQGAEWGLRVSSKF